MVYASIEVVSHVKDYFRKQGLDKTYDINSICVYQGGEPSIGDGYLYLVVAEKAEVDKSAPHFAVWTCWNESTQSLNYGHYCLSENSATKLLEEYEPILYDRPVYVLEDCSQTRKQEPEVFANLTQVAKAFAKRLSECYGIKEDRFEALVRSIQPVKLEEVVSPYGYHLELTSYEKFREKKQEWKQSQEPEQDR